MKRKLFTTIVLNVMMTVVYIQAQQVNCTYLTPTIESSSYKFLRFGTSSAYYAGLMWNNNHSTYGNGNDVSLFTYGNRDLTFYTGTGNVIMFPSSGGKVGIGTSSPLEKLHVIGNIKASESINAAKYYVDGQKAFDANSGFLYIGYGDFPSGIYINKKIRTTENVEPYSNLASDLGNTNSRWNDIYGNYLDLNDRIRLRGVLELKGISEATTPSKFWSIYHNADSDNDYGLIFSYNGTKELSLRDHKVGIGTATPDYKLDVVGTIRAHEIKVNLNKTADHVFASDYSLRSLSETEAFINANHHLPEIASAAEMVENGVNMAEFQIQLLQKIEELTLYVIELEKKSAAQENRINELENLK